jgi:hypothetical protein
MTWGCVAEAIDGYPVLYPGGAPRYVPEIFASKPSLLLEGLQPFDPSDDPIPPQ